jgi:hypothetical protein
MASPTLPKTPVENWEHVRDEWVADVTGLVAEAEAWCREQGWSTRRVPKEVTEDRLGTYTVPQLLIQDVAGRVLLEPLARYVVGGTGLLDLYRMPAYDDMASVVREEGGWQIRDFQTWAARPWSREAFLATVADWVTTRDDA